MNWTILNDDCRQILPDIPSASVDAVLTDPPYPNVKRDYGTMTERDWRAMMDTVVRHCRRILRPSGSALFVLQPMMSRLGHMSTCLYDFVGDWGKRWNLVQDAYWWNHTAIPNQVSMRGYLRPSVKWLVWLGPPDCYRDQKAVLWTESQAAAAERSEHRFLQIPRRDHPSGHCVSRATIGLAAERNGGVSPFNLAPYSNANPATSSGAFGHGAGTPRELLEWWVKYLVPPGGTVLDPFAGLGTTVLAAVSHGRGAIGIERDRGYVESARDRVARFVIANGLS